MAFLPRCVLIGKFICGASPSSKIYALSSKSFFDLVLSPALSLLFPGLNAYLSASEPNWQLGMNLSELYNNVEEDFIVGGISSDRSPVRERWRRCKREE
eukprot:CAMPEP_0197541680 /NCGR_PEP_ID=MMETSP1318-20131121/67293_1 /TAXON_ID=552666 /ORGANISM="Partenskyella glossopodia, Strain RCC365" /LENGTH=98 /DNA_ID=CAMNT_0043100881 /DNA_START=814 /DNA_END=1107 /DNA_ORIENTATION=+